MLIIINYFAFIQSQPLLKGYIWTTQGEVVAKSYAKVVNRHGPNGEVEEDPEEVRSHLQASID